MIVSQEEIILDEARTKLIESGWGQSAAYGTTVSKIIYESDGLEVNGYLAHPVDVSKKYPIIIWNRGGGGNDGRIDEFLAKGMFGEIASWNYVVLASQYRDADEFGGREVNDILNLIGVADEIEFCDSSRMGMEGWSRGGMMTYLVLSKTNRFSCAVIISGLADMIRLMNQRKDLRADYERFFGSEDEKEFTERLKKRSGVYFAGKISKNTKMLLIHGTADKKIPYEDSVDMYEKLNEQGIVCKLELIEDGDHYLKKNRKEVIELRRNWYKKYLD